MKTPFPAALAALLIWTAAAGAQGPDPLTLKARAFVDALARGDFKAAAADFDAKMLEVSGPDKLAAFWAELPGSLGAFKRRTADRRDKLASYEIVLVTCEFERSTLDVRVVFDGAGKIAGFHLVPTLPPAKYETPAYADPAKFDEREVTVGAEPWALPGRLTLPKGPGPFPALVLVHGSGPNDRDETLGPNKPFQDLAWGLASRGIAVLRYDKRTRVYGPKLVADKALAASFTVREETVEDAVAAARLLGATREIDPKRVFILGHSLGGMLIPRIAAAAGPDGAAGFVVMAGLTRRMEDTIVAQTTYLLSLDGKLSDEDTKQLDGLRATAARIKALAEADRGSTEILMGAGPAYWLDLRGYDPAREAAAIRAPILVLQGSRDYQVTTEDFENWKTALAGRRDVAFKLYPKLNHLFFEGQGLPTPNEYTLIHGGVAEYVISDIEAFISQAKPTRRDGLARLRPRVDSIRLLTLTSHQGL